MIELRQYQQDCIVALEAAEQKGIQRQLVSLPTGTGKTILFCTAAKRRNGRTLILAHRDELIQQSVEKLELVWDNVSAGVVKAEWLCGATPLDERRDILARFAQGEIEVLTNCAVLTEGYDNPALDCIILARPTKSKLLYTQMIGRGTRTHPQKEDCLILDVACISDEHDLVSFPSLFQVKPEQNGEQTLTEQLAEKEKKLLTLEGDGTESREVELFAPKRGGYDAREVRYRYTGRMPCPIWLGYNCEMVSD